MGAAEAFFARPLAVLLYDKAAAVHQINQQVNPKWRIREKIIEQWQKGEKFRSVGLKGFLKRYEEEKTKSKLALMEQMLTEEKSWQRYSWVLERLCPEMQIKKPETEPQRFFEPKKWEIVTEKIK